MRTHTWPMKLILIQYAFVDSYLLQLYLNYSPQFPLGFVVFSPSRLPHTIHCDFSQRTTDQYNHYLNQTYQVSSFFLLFFNLCIATCLPVGICPVSFAGAARLVGGSSGNNGRMEVYLNGQWGAVCDMHWTDRDASVICRQLGLG